MNKQILRTLFLLSTFLLSSSPALGSVESSRRILLMRSETAVELGEALVKELSASGFDAITVHKTPDPQLFSDFADLASRLDIVGALRIMPSRDVEIWALDDNTQFSVRRVHRLFGADAASEAIAIVELLRACLLETELGARQKRVRNTIPKKTFRPESGSSSKQYTVSRSFTLVQNPVETPRLSLDLSAAATFGTFETRPLMQLDVRVHYRFGKLLGVELIGLIPIVRLRLETIYGNVRLNTGSVAAGLRFTFRETTHLIRPYLSIGMGMDVASIKSQGVDESLAVNDRRVWGFMPYGAVGTKLRINDYVQLQLGLVVSTVLPRVDIFVMGEEILRWGTLIVSANAGLSSGLF